MSQKKTKLVLVFMVATLILVDSLQNRYTGGIYSANTEVKTSTTVKIQPGARIYFGSDETVIKLNNDNLYIRENSMENGASMTNYETATVKSKEWANNLARIGSQTPNDNSHTVYAANESVLKKYKVGSNYWAGEISAAKAVIYTGEGNPLVYSETTSTPNDWSVCTASTRTISNGEVFKEASSDTITKQIKTSEGCNWMHTHTTNMMEFGQKRLPRYGVDENGMTPSQAWLTQIVMENNLVQNCAMKEFSERPPGFAIWACKPRPGNKQNKGDIGGYGLGAEKQQVVDGVVTQLYTIVEWEWNKNLACGPQYGNHSCSFDVKPGTATIRPIVSIDADSIVFASKSTTPIRTDKALLDRSSFEQQLNESDSEGYKLTLQDTAMNVSNVSTRDGDTDIIRQTGNKIAIKKGVSSLTLNVAASGGGESTPTGISALSSNSAGSEEMFGTLANYNTGGTTEVTIDLSNLMDTNTVGATKTIQLYAEQQNGPQNTDYISAPYEIEVSVVDNDQTLALETGSVMTGEYGTDITLTAVVNEAPSGAERKKFDAVKALTVSVHKDDTDIAEVATNTWDGTTGKTKITLKPKKSGQVRLVLHKDDNFAAGYYVSDNDVVTAEVDIGKRKVTLQPKKQTYKKNEIFQDPVIENQYTGDAGKAGLVNGDTLPNTIKLKTENKVAGEDDNITSRTVSGNKRFDATGTWTQSIDMSAYDAEADASQPLKAKYDFTGDTNDFIVEDALTLDDSYIEITPACTYETDDKKCWNSDTVTIKPSQKAKDAGYTKIKNTTLSNDEIEKSEDGFAESMTISGSRTKIEDIKYNLKSTDDKFITNQGTVEKPIRIDTTEPSTINAKGEKANTSSLAALLTFAEAVTKESVIALGGTADGIRFDSSLIKLTISAVDDESGIRTVEAYKVVNDGAQGDAIALTPMEGDFEEKIGIDGPGNSIDNNKTYSKKVYTALIPEKYKGKVKIVATNNAGLKSYKVTGLIVHETEDEAKEGMVLEAGTGAVMNADGLTYKPNLTNGIVKEDLKFPLKIQAPKSGIKKITYYITDETTIDQWVGSSAVPVDVTNDYGIKVPSGTLNWEDATDNALDTDSHDQAVVSLKEAIAKAKENNKQILKVHAKLESNAGNVKEETFEIKVIDQKIEWDESIQKADTDANKTDNISAVEATYGTPLDITALMADTSTSWSSTGDFTYTLKAGDEKYAKLSATTQSSLTTTGNTVATDKGQAKVTLTPLTGDDTEVTLSVKKAGDDIHLTSNELILKVKLKSKPIKVTADSVTTYDLRTGEKLPVLTSKITDADGTGTGLIVDADAGIDDTAEDKKVDFLLKATGCVKADDTCKISSLETYEQGKTRILETGEWKLEYKYDLTDKTDGTKTGEFNKKYAITFVDYDGTDNADKTLKVTQDSFTEEWYTITPEPNEKVKADKDAWNSSTVTVQPTDKATTGVVGTSKVRTYAQITNDVEIAKGNPNDSTTWGWTTAFTHDKNKDTSAKIYSIRFYDPDTGAFTAAGNAKRSMRVDEDKPSEINFKTEVIEDVSPVLNFLAVIVDEIGGNADGIRFANKGTKLTIDATDLRSGIREIKAYKVNDDGTQGAEIPLTYKEDQSTKNPDITGPTNDVSTYSKKTYTTELISFFNSKVMIVAMDNAGNESTKMTNKIVIEMSDETGMVLDAGNAAPKNADDQYTVSNTYVNGANETLWPLKIQAKKSGIKKITYYITDSEGNPLVGAADVPLDVTGEGKFGITLLDNKVDWTKADEAALVTEEKDEAVVSLKEAVNAMKGKANAVIKVHAKLESNAGNIMEKTFDIHINNQQIDWSQSVKDLDTNKDDNVLTLETEYGKPIKISAEMINESIAWSERSDFTFTLSDDDKKYIHLSDVTYSNLATDGNATGTAKGKGEITLTPLTGNDQTVTLNVKKAGDDTYLESNEVSLTVKLKSKPIDITADSKTTYDVRTGEVHPKLTWKITEKGKPGVDGLVKDDAAGIDDTADDQKVDFLLKATDCVTEGGCESLVSLEDYKQEETRINKIGEWNLEFKYDKTSKNEDTLEDKFNRKYDITFIDSKTADVGSDKTLQVTQDSFTDTWYSITPDLKEAVKDDKHAWNNATVTIKPTEQAKTTSGSGGTEKVRTYNTIINDVLIKDDSDKTPDTWTWQNEFTRTKDEGTDAKIYKLRFRDPITGAFTAEADAKRSVRVDETAPLKAFISVNDDTDPTTIPDAGLIQGKRFSKAGLNIRTSIEDAESGIRSFEVYTVVKNKAEDGVQTEVVNKIDVTEDMIIDVPSTVDGVTEDSTKAVKKRTIAFTIDEEFKGSIRIKAMNNAGEETTFETTQLINEPSAASKLTVKKDETEDNKIPVKITRENYDETYIYPMKIDAPISGIKSIKYTMAVDDVSEETVKEMLKNTGDITTNLGVTEVEDKAVSNTTTVKTPTYALDKDTVKYSDYFPIKTYIEKMIEEKVELGNIKIKIELESNAGNTLVQEFELPVDLLLNDAASYIITPKRVMLKNTEDERGDVKEAVGRDKVILKTVEEADKPAGQDITQYFNIYTPHEITLENAESKTKETYTVSVFDEAGKKLTSEKNLLASLNYDTKKDAEFSLKTPLVTNPEKEKFRGEYNGLMTYTVKYGKKDEGKQP